MPSILKIIRHSTRILHRLLLIKARNNSRCLTVHTRRRGIWLAVFGGDICGCEEGEAGIDAGRDAGCGEELAVLDPAGAFLPVDGGA